MIDLDALVQTTVGDKLDTEFEVTPGGEYIASIAPLPAEGIKPWFKQYKRKSDQTDAVMLNIPFIIQNEELRLKLGRKQLTTRLTIFLDNEADGRLSTGKGQNVGLGQLRDALGQNTDPTWTFAKLGGAGPLKIVTDVTDGQNGQKFSNVTRVAKL